MKKTVITIITLFTLGITSCKKDYTCECTKSRVIAGATIITDDGSYAFKDSKPRAESKCNDQEKTGTDGGGDYTRECQIR